MAEVMSDVFTRVPERSVSLLGLKEYTGDISYLPSILWALAVDPDEAEDVYEQKIVVDVSFNTFVRSGRIEDALVTVADYVRWRRYPRDAMKDVARWMPRLGVWGACAAADTALRNDPYLDRGSSAEAAAIKAIDACRSYALRLGTVQRAAEACEIVGRMAGQRMLTSLYSVMYIGSAMRSADQGDRGWFVNYIGNVASSAADTIRMKIERHSRMARRERSNRELMLAADAVIKSAIADACIRYPVRVELVP